MIRVQNVYYMLTYAFQLLKQQDYKSIAAVDFPSAEDMMAAILIKGIEKQIKRGLKKDYIPQTEALTSLREERLLYAKRAENTQFLGAFLLLWCLVGV